MQIRCHSILAAYSIVQTCHALSSPSIHNNEISRRAALTSASSSVLLPTLARAEELTSETKQLVGGQRITLPNASLSCPTSPRASKLFPLASFGLQIYDDATAYSLTLTALECGYRNFFASVLAGNQKGFAKAVKDSGVSREEMYICGTVLSNRAQGEEKAYKKTLKGCQENMEAMSSGGIDYLDQIMLDYPGPDQGSILGQWTAFQEFQQQNLVTDLSVSNFSPTQLDYVLKSSSTCAKPVVNQLPLSIAYHPTGLLQENIKRGMHVQSWSPLSTTLPKYRDVLANIGKKYNKSGAQVGLRWILQSGGSFCTQSKKKEHFKEDLEVFDFSLTDAEMEKLSILAPPRVLG